MVFAVQCPSPKCRKFMLVEDRDLNQVVPCLLCKTPIKVGSPAAPAPAPPSAADPLTPPPQRRK
jgi:hypothetical protein